jgi:hypothetical protein
LPRFSIFLIFELFPRFLPVPLPVVSGGEPVAVGAPVDCEGELLLALPVVSGGEPVAVGAPVDCEGELLLPTVVERSV